jgi:hypothetical protein
VPSSISKHFLVNNRILVAMAPGATLPVDSHSLPNGHTTKSRNTAPLKKSGALDAAFTFDELTPAIGREYPNAKIVEDILNASNADDLLRDLAITSKYGSHDIINTKSEY